MRKILARTMERGKMIAFYVNKNDPEKFAVGKILLVGESDILAILYDIDASPETICYCSVDAIYRIEQDSLYLRKLQKEQRTECVIPDFGANPWDSFFKMQSQYDRNICCLQKNGEQTNGVVMQYSKSTIILSLNNNNEMPKRMSSIHKTELVMLTGDILNRGL